MTPSADAASRFNRRGRRAACRRAGRAGLLAAALVVAAPALAAASEVGAVGARDRLAGLERAADALEMELAALGGPAPSRPAAAPPRPELTPVQAQLPQGYAAQVEVRLTQLERQISDLTGRLERLQYEQSQVGARLDRALSDIEYRLTVLEGGDPTAAPPSRGSGGLDSGRSGGASTSGSLTGGSLGGGSLGGGSLGSGNLGGGSLSAGQGGFGNTGATAPAAAAGLGSVSGGNTLGALSGSGGSLTGSGGSLTGSGAAPGSPAGSPAGSPPGTQTAALPAGDVMGQYDEAYGMLQRGDWAGAEQAFNAFVSRHGDHPLASNAQYWLGETYMARNQYDRAATAFARGYQRFPQGAKASDSLLKLGTALGEMGQTGDACLTFDRLLQDFPNANAATRRRVADLEARFQC